ncbi:hypothetical protein [Methylobacterium sp. J-076]|uniref:hypothetical protein n=1 Tax=Methylobacterium sp. J-076 TaxID=2836655 RepID=UPI001FBB2462|nr:hypothetical protein [Methylobacterium sp. J-076]MCJ2011578.1 hypothetical protein [Methylobacterium sp. J-076]
MLDTLKKALRRLSSGSAHDRAMRDEAVAREDGVFAGTGTERARVFESDYHAAVELLRVRMDAAHPPACHEKLSTVGASSYEYGERRLATVDAASTAIAMALRAGATVEQAAESGASSLGL